MLGLLGLLGAMFAGILGDSFLAQPTRDTADDDATPPAPEEVATDASGDFVGDPVPQPTAEAAPESDPAPEDALAPADLPGDDPDAAPDAPAQLLVGTNNADMLVAGDGNDGLLGAAGEDTLMGGAGHDALVGADDEDADLLQGGDGNDSLTLGAGDTGTGDAGQDLFTLSDFGPNTPPALITDYSPQDDHIVLMYDPAVHPEPVVATAAIDGSNDMSVLLDGVQIAIVQGAPGLTLADIQLMAA